MAENPAEPLTFPWRARATRRDLLKTFGYGAAAWIAGMAAQRSALAQTAVIQAVQTPVLNLGYVESGDRQGFPIILLHGFPDDAHAYDDVSPLLVKAGYRVLVPFLRGYGPSQYRDRAAAKMGEQASLAQDVMDLASALRLDRFAVSGFDWGGRAACIVAALYPERVRAAVLIGGYTIQDVFAAPRPAPPEAERALWYQWYFQSERGRLGLAQNRKAFCKLLWQLWSPTWHFTDEVYDRTAISFENPDFVDIVIHSYRHRNGNAPGEPRFMETERKLAERPKISVPTIVLHGADDGIAKPPADSPAERAQFTSLVARRVIAGAGHFLPREKPEVLASALIEVLGANR